MSSLLDEILEKRRVETTPDFLQLKLTKHLVFVYGTMKFGMKDHHIIAGSPYLGKAISQSNTFKMYNWETGDFPVALSYTGAKREGGHLEGEVYLVDAMTMLKMDAIQQNGQSFQRHMRMFRFMEQKCWVYIGMPEMWEGRIHYGTSQKKVGEMWCYDWHPRVRPTTPIRPFDYGEGWPDVDIRDENYESMDSWMDGMARSSGNGDRSRNAY